MQCFLSLIILQVPLWFSIRFMIIAFYLEVLLSKSSFSWKKKKKLMDDQVVNYPNIITVIIIITHLFIDSKFKLTPIRTSSYNNLFLCKANWDQIYIIPSIETTNNLNLVTIIKKSDNANKWNCQTLIVIRWFM